MTDSDPKPDTTSRPSPESLGSAEPVDSWMPDELEPMGFFENAENVALIGSMLVHLIIILSLAMVPLAIRLEDEAVVIVSKTPEYEQEEIETIDDITYSDIPQVQVGAASLEDAGMAEASAEMFAEVSEIPMPLDLEPDDLGDIMVNKMFDQAVAPLDKLEDQKGKVGQGAAGAVGAVDRITFEILKEMEESPTLVVWMFDLSGSLERQRRDIRNRFDRIYSELGIAEASGSKSFANNEDKESPLLTSIMGFGQEVKLFTPEPISDLDEIKSIIDEEFTVDTSGEEKVFTAIASAANQYKSLAKPRGNRGPLRKVMFIVVTDEKGDDEYLLETSIKSCRNLGIPVYVIGVPAPFGRQHTLVKYVDPDPTYDQTPQFAQVDQGPETFYPEHVQVGFTGDFQQEPVIDSGFGPYALTRLCYETGGIYFTVHPNRNVSRKVRRGELDAFASELEYFFDPTVMQKYRPDYLTQRDYENQIKASPLRMALKTAAEMKPVTGLSRPRMRFVRREDAQLVGDLSEAQKEPAKLEYDLRVISETLMRGFKHREDETSLRWRAGYDLAMGRVLAQKVRTETYNAILAEAKSKAFKDPKNNTWVLEPSEDITVGSRWQNEAAMAKKLLQGVVDDHAGTPWALLASEELKVPIGWKWTETYTDLNPPKPNPGNGNNNPPRPPKDDKAKMLKKRPKDAVLRL
ncbi:VWA domain-containing protein [Rubripirellula amarantea]|nr:VWA domain-containing protein [Rubripirellula amarantea]